MVRNPGVLDMLPAVYPARDVLDRNLRNRTFLAMIPTAAHARLAKGPFR